MKPDKNTDKQIALVNNALSFEKAQTVFLCDVSGSMHGSVYGTSKLRMMHNTLLGVIPSVGEARVILFDGKIYPAKTWADVTAMRWEAGTAIAKALRYARRLNPERVILITDGEPTDGADEAREIAASMLARIDVFYCGEGNAAAVEFCRSLAQYGGECHIDPTGITMLESVTLMLGNGTIEL